MVSLERIRERRAPRAERGSILSITTRGTCNQNDLLCCNHKDFKDRYPSLARALAAMPDEAAIDGITVRVADS